MTGRIIPILLLIPLLAFSQLVKAQQSTLKVHFDFDQWNISQASKALLDSILQQPFLSNKNIHIYGHCDSIGNDIYNDALSERRVLAVKDYLVSKGLNKNNIAVEKAFGRRKPLNKNSSRKERYDNRRVEILLKEKEKTITEIINDSTTKKGTTIILKNLNFLGSRHTLVKESWPVLVELLHIMRQNPGLEIAINGHVCCTSGKEGYDMETRTWTLSSNRAQYIYRYFIDNGIKSSRLTWKGYGNTQPMFIPEDTEEKRKLNRRVEIKILNI